MKILKSILIFGIVFYSLIVFAMYNLQEKLLYLASHEYIKPEALGLSGVSEIELLTSDNEKLVSWYSKASPGKPTILFFHGNGGSISARPQRFAFYTSQGYGAFFLEYRSFGASTGSPSEAGLMMDAEAAYNWLNKNGVSPKDIMLAGESLGTGVATITASRHQVAALSLQAPYTSVADVAAARYWWLPVRLLIKDPFDAASAITKVHVPVLMQHGEIDQTILIRFGQTLFAAANEPKEFVVVPGGYHNIFDEKRWARELAFFDSVREPK
jgi:uncharacterized protein